MHEVVYVIYADCYIIIVDIQMQYGDFHQRDPIGCTKKLMRERESDLTQMSTTRHEQSG